MIVGIPCRRKLYVVWLGWIVCKKIKVKVGAIKTTGGEEKAIS